jgi:membrane-bound lytic murein transglycosylase B
MMKIVSIVIAALLIVTSLFNSIAVAESEVAGKQEITGKEIKKNKTGKRTGVKKKSRGKKRKPVIPDSIEKRKTVLKASFRRAGISQEDIDNIFSDERIELHAAIYEKPEQKESGRKKKPGYFDEEFGLFKPESIESGKKIISDNKELFKKIESLYGVPANYIAAIIRVETDFKEHLG